MRWRSSVLIMSGQASIEWLVLTALVAGILLLPGWLDGDSLWQELKLLGIRWSESYSWYWRWVSLLPDMPL